MAAELNFLPTPLHGLVIVDRRPVADARGFLSRVYCADAMRAAGMMKSIAQINHTMTRRAGTVRGLHFQRPPHAEMKLVTCVRGEVFDVAVDVRQNSATYLRWHAERLSAENQRSLLIPEGFAHGFQAMTSDCELLYLHTADYRRDAEAGLSATDPRIAISWPLDIAEMSERDRSHPVANADFRGVTL